MQFRLPKSDTPRVSIIIVSGASTVLLWACLRSIAQHAPTTIPFETIVIMNEGTPDAEIEFRDQVEGVILVNSPINLGLAGAGNRGRSLAKGEYLILLHDDTEIEPGWMEALVETADAHPEAGAVGGKVLHPDGRLQSAGMVIWADGTTHLPWVGEAPHESAFDDPRAVDYCGTSSLLVRASAWDAIGGLEERFYPVYYVDVDLSMALRQLGLVVLYQPKSRTRHHQGASGSLRLRHFTGGRNRLFFTQKWHDALKRQPHPGKTKSDIETAMKAAQALAADYALKGPPLLNVQRSPFDAQKQERLHYDLNRRFQQDYIKHLTETVEARENELRNILAKLRPKTDP